MRRDKTKIRPMLKKTNSNSNMIHNNIQDYDLASIYPSNISVFNISEENCMTKIEFWKGIEDHTETFMDHYSSREALLFCPEYLSVPTITEMYNLILEELQHD